MGRNIQGNNTVLASLDLKTLDLSYLPTQTGEADAEYVLPRDGDRALRFKGSLVGSSVPEDAPVGTVVSIWKTQGGNYITYVHQWQCRDTGLVERRKGGAHASGETALEWFKDNNRGSLGTVTLEAWEQACANDPDLASLQYENID